MWKWDLEGLWCFKSQSYQIDELSIPLVSLVIIITSDGLV